MFYFSFIVNVNTETDSIVQILWLCRLTTLVKVLLMLEKGHPFVLHILSVPCEASGHIWFIIKELHD